MEDKKAYIFASGDVSDYDYIASRISNNGLVLCADGGLEHCLKCGISPDVVIGDMDSYVGEVDEDILIKFPVEKDDTDTSLCIKYAIEKGYKDIEIFGALGGRIDHSLANVQLLLYCKEKGVSCILSDKRETAFIVRNECIKKLIGKERTVSIFSISVKSDNITLKGLKYSLENADLYCNFPLGVSNTSICDEIEVSVGDGTLLVVISQ